jgi:ABC-type bacteriocin/lantibiotic exporter with double-glycine peptidase domain
MKGEGAMKGSDWPRPRLLLLICAHVLALLAYPFAVGMLVNSLVGADLRGFGLWAGVLICLPIAEALLYTAREADMDTWAEKVGADLRTRLLRHTLSLPLTYFHTAKSGQLVTRLTDNVREFADGRVLVADGIKHALTIAFALVLLTTGHGLLLALVTAVGCAYAVNAALLLPALRRHSARNLQALENLNEHLRERLHILPFTRFMGSARWEAEQFRRLSETEVRAAQSREALVKTLISSASAVLQSLSVGSLYAVGGYLLYRRAISLGELLMAAGYAARVSFASQQLVETAKKYQAAYVAGRNAREIFSAEPERWPGRRTPPDVVRSVEWRGVSFRYPGREWVLKDFSLRVEAGELTALVGPSGSGKSTALDILAGLLQPEAGAVIINDAIDLRELDIGAWRARVAYGTQFQFFFAGSLRQNLAYPSQDGQEQQLIELAGRLGLHREIVSRPGGYDAIQQIQKTFSGGQRQRLGLIRALLKPAPALLILDEPTAALDASAQALVMNLISPLKHRCPVLITTHRPSTMTYADKVARLEDGRAVPR